MKKLSFYQTKVVFEYYIKIKNIFRFISFPILSVFSVICFKFCSFNLFNVLHNHFHFPSNSINFPDFVKIYTILNLYTNL